MSIKPGRCQHRSKLQFADVCSNQNLREEKKLRCFITALIAHHLNYRIIDLHRFLLILNHCKRKSVDKEDNIRSAVLAFGQLKFRAHMEMVILRLFEINKSHLRRYPPSVHKF